MLVIVKHVLQRTTILPDARKLRNLLFMIPTKLIALRRMYNLGFHIEFHQRKIISEAYSSFDVKNIKQINIGIRGLG